MKGLIGIILILTSTNVFAQSLSCEILFREDVSPRAHPTPSPSFDDITARFVRDLLREGMFGRPSAENIRARAEQLYFIQGVEPYRSALVAAYNQITGATGPNIESANARLLRTTKGRGDSNSAQRRQAYERSWGGRDVRDEGSNIPDANAGSAMSR